VFFHAGEAVDNSSSESRNRIAFGDFCFSPSERVLERAGQPVRLGGRAMDILIALVEQAGQVVSQRELFARIWPDQAVDASILRVHITTLRKVLGDSEGDATRYIANIPGRGYSFVAPLSSLPAVETAMADSTAPPTNLSLPLTEIIGRERELTELTEWLKTSRLVTLVGPGGVGKTRLAVELGWRVLAEFPAGVWLIDLALLTDPDAVARATAAALGVSILTAEAAVESIIGALGKVPRLLIFDNCEHLVDATAALVKMLLERAPGLCVLATSQRDLRLAAERVYGLDPLEVPPADAVQISGFAAADLFTARARGADRLFELHDGNSAGVGAICRHLDGLPLALEMAAARLRMLGVEGLRRGLDDRLKMLKGAPTDDARHASLREVVEWSHGLLAPGDQRVFRRLAAFPGSFSHEAAIDVASAESAERWDIVDSLGRLIDRSLVTLAQHEPPRYRLLETLRLYAMEKLQASGEAAAIAERHAQHFQEVFEAADLSWDETPDPDWIGRYQPELDNLRTALDWSLAEPERRQIAIALLGSSGQLLYDLSLIAEGIKYLDRTIPLIDEDTPPNISARLMMRAFYIGHALFDPRGPTWAERALALYRQLDDRRGLASALMGRGLDYFMRKRYIEAEAILLEAQQLLTGSKFNKRRLKIMADLGRLSYFITNNVDEARRCFMQALELAHALKYHREPMIRLNLGVIEYMAGNIDRAIEVTREALNQVRLPPMRDGLGQILCNLGAYLIANGNTSDARPVLEEALVLFAERRNYGARECLQPWAVLTAVEGRFAEAAQLIGFADELRRRQGVGLWKSELPMHNRLMGILAAGLPPAELEALQAEGARWSEADAVEFAVARLLPRPTSRIPSPVDRPALVGTRNATAEHGSARRGRSP